MKLLIVLGLIPLFSAQQMGFFGFPNMMAFRQAQGGAQVQAQGNPKKEYNNNAMWAMNFPGFGNQENQKNNLFGLNQLNNGLVQNLRFMTDSLVSLLKQLAKDPRTDEVFKVMDKICVSNIEETIEALKLGSNAAEMGLLDSTELLGDALEGKVKLNKEGFEAAKEAAKEAFNKLSSSSSSSSSSSAQGRAQDQVQVQGNPKKEYNNNNLWAFNLPGFGNQKNQKNNLFGLNQLNKGLVQNLRFMTDSLVSLLKQLAKDPRTDEVFKVMDKICVGSIEETIEALKLGSNAAEMGLLDSTELLGDALEGKVKLNKEGFEAAKVAAKEAFNKLSSSSSSSSQKGKY